MNAVVSNVVRASISSPVFHERLEDQRLLRPLEGVVIIEGEESGIVYECGPKGGCAKTEAVGYLDVEKEVICQMLGVRVWACIILLNSRFATLFRSCKGSAGIPSCLRTCP